MDEIREQTEGEKKLSQLLGEYMEEKKKNPEGFLDISTALMAGSKVGDVYMVSKEFGFIERLVDSDKIDRAFIKDVRYPYYLEKGGLLQGYEESDSLIMILAISDNPIEDLISYLK